MSTCIIVCVFIATRMKSELFTLKNIITFLTAWEVAGEYVYTTPGDQDSDYLTLMLNVPGYRLSHACF